MKRPQNFEETSAWLESIPQILFVILIAGVVAYSAYDFDHVMELFERFVEWVQLNPLQSSLSIFLIYIALVIFTFPIIYLTVALGYAYSKAFVSKPQALLGVHSTWNTVMAFGAALTLITIALIVGALLAFLISRYWLGKTIKKRCLKNHRSFIAVNAVVT